MTSKIARGLLGDTGWRRGKGVWTRTHGNYTWSFQDVLIDCTPLAVVSVMTAINRSIVYQTTLAEDTAEP